MATAASILRIGPTDNNLSAIILTKALAAQFATKNEDDNSDDNSTSLYLENKYFTANVFLKEIGATVNDTASSKEDGVILVFDALLSNPDRASPGDGITFDSLEATHNLAERNDTCGDLLRLCVGVSLGEHSPEELRGANHEKEYSRRILWCLDHGYEYVEADLSQEGQLKGHEDRDKDGFARVVEAIQGTMWSSAVVGAARTQQLKTEYASDKAAVEEQAKEEEGENPYQPPDPSLLQSTKDASTTKDDTKTAEEDGDNNAQASTLASSLLDPSAVGAPEMAQLRQDLEAEKVFDKMEGLLKEANQIRTAAKDGTMTDDERRERAGDAALALVNLMGQFGLDEDESDADSSVGSED